MSKQNVILITSIVLAAIAGFVTGRITASDNLNRFVHVVGVTEPGQMFDNATGQKCSTETQEEVVARLTKNPPLVDAVPAQNPLETELHARAVAARVTYCQDLAKKWWK